MKNFIKSIMSNILKKCRPQKLAKGTNKMQGRTINIQEVKERAEQYYRDGDFYCSEALLKAVKDAFEDALDYPFSDDVIKLASGFPVGMGAGCTCGAVNGAVMSLGMFFGRNEAKGKEVEKCMALTKELQEKFTALRKVCCCKILTKGMELGSQIHLKHCITITGEVTEIVAEIIARELDYTIV